MQVTTSSSTSTDGIDAVFAELHGMYGNKFLDAYRSGHIVHGADTGIENAKRVWAEKIRAHQMTRGQLRRGLAACERLKFPPTWGEFLALCQPEPDPTAAYQEAIAGLDARARGEVGEWSHPAIYWAATEVRQDLMHLSYAAMRERWAAALRRHLAKGEWAPIPPPREALPAPGQAMTSREEAVRRLREIGAAGILRSPDAPADRIGWARRIVTRAEAGEHVTPTVLAMAREMVRRDDAGSHDMRDV